MKEKEMMKKWENGEERRVKKGQESGGGGACTHLFGVFDSLDGDACTRQGKAAFAGQAAGCRLQADGKAGAERIQREGADDAEGKKVSNDQRSAISQNSIPPISPSVSPRQKWTRSIRAL